MRSYNWQGRILLLLSIGSGREKNIFIARNRWKAKILFLSDDGIQSSETESDVTVEKTRKSCAKMGLVTGF